MRIYKRKSDRQCWDIQNMEYAIKSVINKENNCKRASIIYKVPRSTLRRKISQYKQEQADLETICKQKIGFKPVFTVEQEQQICNYVVHLESILMGLTRKEIQEIAFQLAERSGIKHPFNNETQAAGKDWMDGFLKRHPQLSLRKPENTSATRARGFNKTEVNEFFAILEPVMMKHNFSEARIYNVDETDVTVVPKSASKIVASKGRKQVGSLTAAERGELVTAEICMSASGS